jgi:hypothetical protein
MSKDIKDAHNQEKTEKRKKKKTHCGDQTHVETTLREIRFNHHQRQQPGYKRDSPKATPLRRK